MTERPRQGPKMSAKKKIASNSAMMLAKVGVSTLVTLYVTRALLHQLGATDYGIYFVVVGAVNLLSFLNTTMTVSTQRYMSFHLGKGEDEKSVEVFGAGVWIHFWASILVLVLLEAAAPFLYHGLINVPLDRIDAAYVIYQFLVVSSFVTINSIPNDALLSAHENLGIDAIASILESLVRVVFVLFLPFLDGDGLVIYGAYTAASLALVRVAKLIYCYARYPLYYASFVPRRGGNINAMVSFAGWNSFGGLMSLGKTQGLALIVNHFAGPAANAMYGIAMQLASRINLLTDAVKKSFGPQITKRIGAGEIPRAVSLAATCSKSMFLLYSLAAVPLLVSGREIFDLWLTKYPPETIELNVYFLLAGLVIQCSVGMMIVIQGIGVIRLYTVVMSILLLLNLPVAWILLRAGLPIGSVVASALAFEIVALFVRAAFFAKLARGSLLGMIVEQFVRPATMFLIVGGAAFTLTRIAGVSLVGDAILIASVYSLILPTAAYFVLLNKEERVMARAIALGLLRRFRPRTEKQRC